MGFNDYKVHNPDDRPSLHDGLAHGLKKQKDTDTFGELMGELKLKEVYTAYKTDVLIDEFNRFAQNMPDMSSTQPDDTSSSSSKSKTSIRERNYVKKFTELLDELFGGSKLTAIPEKYSESPYIWADNQDKGVGNTLLKPDLVLYRKAETARSFKTALIIIEAKQGMSADAAFRKYGDQVANYAWRVWKNQPMRTFVPVLFLVECDLYLVVFTRAGYYKAHIGPVMYVDVRSKNSNKYRAAVALRDLWFLLTLPADRLGLFDASPFPFKCLYIDPHAQLAALKVVEDESAANVTVGDPIEQRMPLTGRCAHLYRVRYDNKDAILKLSWTRTNRLPEGAVYEVLGTKQADGNPYVSGIPQVYRSGILVEDFNGYRLEYLLIEDCGVTIGKYFEELRKRKRPANEIADEAKRCVASVLQTLAEARHVSVLHRDVSVGNITIKDGRVYVIDWGYAKLLCAPNEPLSTVTATRLKDEQFVQDFSERWSIDLPTVIATEYGKDPFTGTSLYMSIQVLLGVRRRNVFNDIESLFYVIMDALSTRKQSASSEDSPAGFVFYSSKTTAYARMGILAHDQLHLEEFGVDRVSLSGLVETLAAMHKFLFFDNGRYIGGELRGEYQRKFDRDTARAFMNERTIILLDSRVETMEQEPTSPQKTELVGSGTNASELPIGSLSRRQTPLQLPNSRGLDIDDSDSGGGDENARPLVNRANAAFSPTPGASQVLSTKRGPTAAKVIMPVPLSFSERECQVQTRPIASTASYSPLTAILELGDDDEGLSDALTGDGADSTMSLSFGPASASDNKRPRDTESATDIGQQMRAKWRKKRVRRLKRKRRKMRARNK
ncbi:hypothetical protein GGI19_001016 [Coemansia pectinata]|uniref:60S ribosomal protein L41 n=1 Tax=Coemansia pectinata TaxID=1052879 RepID=A0A9W8LBN1_9FUNG|nr:hypothetical protein GGI19_001016 [Coemansia pectinata]